MRPYDQWIRTVVAVMDCRSAVDRVSAELNAQEDPGSAEAEWLRGILDEAQEALDAAHRSEAAAWRPEFAPRGPGSFVGVAWDAVRRGAE